MREDAAAEVHRLRAQLERMQGRKLGAPVLPTPPVFAGLLSGGGLRAGRAYELGSSAGLLLSLLARPTLAGSWCAAIGMPELGAEAAAGLGVVLDRFVLVPEPGPRWLAVAATLAEVMTVIAVRATGRVTDAEASRLQARLRDRGAVLLVQGRWPQAEASLEVTDSHWNGLSQGHGYLAEREVTVTVRTRQSALPRRAKMLLPDRVGALTAAPTDVPLPLRAVG